MRGEIYSLYYQGTSPNSKFMSTAEMESIAELRYHFIIKGGRNLSNASILISAP